MDRQGFAGRACELDPLVLGFGRLQSLLHKLLYRILTDHFPELSAGGRLGMKFQHQAGAIVGEENGLLGIDGDDSLDHAPEDGAELLAVFVELQPVLQMPQELVGLGQAAVFRAGEKSFVLQT